MSLVTPFATYSRAGGACVIASALASAVHADDRISSWISPSGGFFHTSKNWSNGVPGASDTAIFSLGATYVVTFTQSVVNRTLMAEEGEVTFDLPFVTYSVEEGIVGNGAGDDALWTIRNGTLSVTNAALFLQIGNERGANGTLNITRGANLVTQAAVLIGDDAGSIGTATVDGIGSTWNCPGRLTVGERGDGFVSITNGGTLTTDSALLAREAPAVAMLTVRGAGSRWTDNGMPTVGNRGTGSLEIDAGGTVIWTGLSRLANNSRASQGIVRVDGSLLRVLSELFVGNDGTGSIELVAGGRVESTRVKLGDNPGSFGSVSVHGTQSVWTDSAEYIVGNFGTGELKVFNTGSVSSPLMTIGDDPGSAGTTEVRGAGSSLAITGAIRNGNLGQGRLRAIDGARVTGASYAQSAISRLDIVLGPASAGTTAVAVTDAATVDGVLVVSLKRCFVPNEGQEFNVITAANVTGAFDSVTIAQGLRVIQTVNRVYVLVEDSCPADIDDSGVVDFGDLLAVLAAWGECPACPEDLNGDGRVNFNDLLALLCQWGPCP